MIYKEIELENKSVTSIKSEITHLSGALLEYKSTFGNGGAAAVTLTEIWENEMSK